MARISEFEQDGYDSIEIAITAEEYARLGTGPDQLRFQVGAFTAAGADYGSPIAASTNQADWTLDPDTGEYIYIPLEMHIFNITGTIRGSRLRRSIQMARRSRFTMPI